MPSLKDFSAWVQVDGQPLSEYQIEYSDSETGFQVTCWIPSESGKAPHMSQEFQICYKDAARTTSTGTKVSVDGIRCTGRISYAKHLHKKNKSTIVHKGITVSDTTIRPFIFSDCKLVEDESNQLPVNLTSLGEIKIEVSEIEVGSPTRRRTQSKFPLLHIHERAKKGIVHGTQLGKEVLMQLEKPPRKTTELRSLVSFVFKYRPLDILMADGVASPPAPEKRASYASDVDFIDLTLDDEESGNNGRVRQHSNPKTIKREVKREGSMTFDNAVIDLTV